MSPKSLELPGKIKERKIKGKKNINLQRFPTAKTSDTLLYVDDEVLKVKTVVNIDGTLEIFIATSDKKN